MSNKTKVVVRDGGYVVQCACGFSSYFGGTDAQQAARRLAKTHGAACNEPVNAELAAASTKWHKAKEAERTAMMLLYVAINHASEGGMSEVAIARQAGVDRMTVRRALGKL